MQNQAKGDKNKRIQAYILRHLDEYPTNIINVAAQQLAISRHQVRRHIRYLINDGIIDSMGVGDTPYYILRVFHNKEFRVLPKSGLQTESIWFDEIEPMLAELPANVLGIWQYGFTAILENVATHANANSVLIGLKKTALTVEISLLDDGDGIFHSLCHKLELPDETCAVSHFLEQQASSIHRIIRSFDQLIILSGQTWLSYKRVKHDSLNGEINCQIERAGLNKGTLVSMKLFNDVQRCLPESH